MSEETKVTFLRQSGWIALATGIGGAAAYAVHLFAKEMPKAEYGVFGAMLQFINLLAIPGIGLQTVFAQKFATVEPGSDAEDDAHRERAAVMTLWSLVWLVLLVVALATSGWWVEKFQLGSTSILLLGVATGLFALILPLEYGVQQGRQNFFQLGWAILLVGGARFVLVPIFFAVDEPDPFWAMLAVLVGFAAAYAVASWRLPWPECGDFLEGTAKMFRTTDWGDLLRRFIPLSLGGGAIIFMMSVDMVIVQHHFPAEQTGLYVAAGMIGRALIFLVGPIVAVMFPKIVRAHAEKKPTDILNFTLALTAALCLIAGALGMAVPEWPLRIIYDESYLAVAPLVSWFIWVMVPLALSAVLVNSLLAQRKFSVVYALAGVCLVYAIGLWVVSVRLAKTATSVFSAEPFVGVVKVIGLGNLAFLAVAVGFTIWHRRRSRDAEEER